MAQDIVAKIQAAAQARGRQRVGSGRVGGAEAGRGLAAALPNGRQNDDPDANHED